MLLRHTAVRALSRACASEGTRMAIKSAMMATTTNTSIKVNAFG
jgi:hypothetical protein